MSTPSAQHVSGPVPPAVGVAGRAHPEIRPFIEKVFQNTPPLRQRYRSEYFTNGRKVTWEYPHDTPQGEQMDFVEPLVVSRAGWGS